MSAAAYYHRAAGRRMATLIALAAATCFLVFAALYNAPWWFYPPVLLAFAPAAWAVLSNPQSGMRLNAQQLTFFSGSWSRSVGVTEVASISITDWSEGPPTATINLKDGSGFDVPLMCLPLREIFVCELRAHGVSVN